MTRNTEDIILHLEELKESARLDVLDYVENERHAEIDRIVSQDVVYDGKQRPESKRHCMITREHIRVSHVLLLEELIEKVKDLERINPEGEQP